MAIIKINTTATHVESARINFAKTLLKPKKY